MIDDTGDLIPFDLSYYSPRGPYRLPYTLPNYAACMVTAKEVYVLLNLVKHPAGFFITKAFEHVAVVVEQVVAVFL